MNRLSKEQVMKIVELRDNGHIQSYIAKEVGCSKSTVSRNLKKLINSHYDMKKIRSSIYINKDINKDINKETTTPSLLKQSEQKISLDNNKDNFLKELRKEALKGDKVAESFLKSTLDYSLKNDSKSIFTSLIEAKFQIIIKELRAIQSETKGLKHSYDTICSSINSISESTSDIDNEVEDIEIANRLMSKDIKLLVKNQNDIIIFMRSIIKIIYISLGLLLILMLFVLCL